MTVKAHWEDVHGERDADEVSWFQPEPKSSITAIEGAGVGSDARVIDVGCGAAGIAGALLARGFRHVTALDVSGAALQRARERLGPERADQVDWVEADLLAYTASTPFDAWHDRAVLHFLTAPEDQRRYADAVRRNVAPGGWVILATFAPDGPEACSGLPVQRYDADGLARLLGDGFTLQHATRETHVTPWGTEQRFQWAVLRRET